jgi:hypothetical protein
VTLPRTLIVSEAPFGVANGFAVTLSTFFDGWPANSVRLFYTRAVAAEADGVGQRTTFADVPGYWGRRYGLACLLGRRPTWRGRYSAAWLRSALDGWRPEVVYAFVFSGETLAFAAWVAERFRCPFVVHVADDGLETEKAGVTRDVRSLLGAAARRLSISEEMRVEYLNRYGLDSEVLHNGASEELFEAARPTSDRDCTFVVRYLGSVVPSHHDLAIEDIAAAVRVLAASGLAVRFELCGGSWTRQNAEKMIDGGTVVYRGQVSRAEGFDLLKSASLLLVPVSFDPARFLHVRLSLPTKLTECLASGTPTLVYGPRGCAPVEFCRRHGVGIILDERSPDRLEALLRRLAFAPDDARRDAGRDRTVIRERYSAVLARGQLRALIGDAANVRSCR